MEGVEEIIFDRLMSDKRHKELVATVKAAQKNDELIVQALDRQSIAIEQFVQAIKSLPTPSVNVQTNQNEVVISVSQMCDKILSGLSELKLAVESKPVIDRYEWSFVRGQYTQTIEKATATVIYKK